MPLNPMGKVMYLCDEVLRDPTSGKISFLGIFDDVISTPALGFPFRLGRICLAAQLVGGSGYVAVDVDIVEAATQNLVRTAGPFIVHFPSRRQIVTVQIRILDVLFPAAGEYFVELYSHGVFLDDRLLRLQ